MKKQIEEEIIKEIIEETGNNQESPRKDPPRDEFEDTVKCAYHGAVMDEQEKAEIKEKLLKRHRNQGRLNISYKIGTVVAAVLVFVAVNAVIIGLNLKHGKVMDNPTDSTENTTQYATQDATQNTIQDYAQQNDLSDVKEGDIIYGMQVNPYVLESYGEGDGYSISSRTYTAQVVFKEMAVTDSKELNAKLNNENKITGSFEIQIVDEAGKVISSFNLSTGATSEHGITLNTDKESLDEYFYAGKYSDMVIFCYPMGEENGQKRYLTSFYGVDEYGNIFLYEVDENLPKEVWPYSNFELVTSENFGDVANEPGLWWDYCVFGDKNLFVFYNFDVDAKKIKRYYAFEGVDSGEAVESALSALLVRYDLLMFSYGVPLESEDIVEGVIMDENQKITDGYQQVLKEIAGSEEEFLDYIENTATSLKVYGYSNREELRQRLFVEKVDLSDIDKSRLIGDNVTHYKMLDGKLCFFYIYDGVPWSFGERYVAQQIDEKNVDFYCELHAVDGMGMVRVRMVLENDGVWRAAEFEELDIVTQRSVKQVSYNEKLIEMHVGGWANQFCLGNGEGIVPMCSEELKNSLIKQNRLWQEDDVWTIKDAGAWPSSTNGYRILNFSENYADILYYARTNEPHVTVWRQGITYEMGEGGFVVKGESLDKLEHIVTLEEFYAAYPDGIIAKTGMDYMPDGQVNVELYKNADGNRNSEPYKWLYNPETSARYLLNILNNENKVSISSYTKEVTGEVYVTFSFKEMGGMATVVMTQMGDTGIWIPKTTEKEAVKENVLYTMEADMDNDGINDYIVTSIQSSSDEEVAEPEELLQKGELLYVRVYRGTGNDPQVEDNKFYGLDCVWWMEYAGARPGNGQVSVVCRDGKNYLLTSSLNEQFGIADYSYRVISLESEGEYTDKFVDEYAVKFAFEEGINSVTDKREDVVPEFQKRIEAWFDDAVLIAAIDMQEFYISTQEKVFEPENYYDRVWERKY